MGLFDYLNKKTTEFTKENNALYEEFSSEDTDHVEKLEITRHQITNAEMMIAGGTDMKSMEQENNIEITYQIDGKRLKLRVEMLTGISLYGQAGKCREMMDVLLQNGILDKFSGEKKAEPAPTTPALSSADELKKFKELLDMGAISQEDFDAKKKQLLGL